MFGGSLINDAALARSGNWRYNGKITTPTVNGGVNVNLAALTLNASELFDLRARICFQPITFPSVTDFHVGVFSGVPELRLEMNTTGALRRNGSGGFSPPSAYQGSTSLGRWYYADFRIHGLRTAGTDNEFRIRGTIDVYDVGTNGLASPALVVGFTSEANESIFADLNSVSIAPGCPPPGSEPTNAARLTPPSGTFEFDKIAAMVSGYDINLLDSVNLSLANGGGWTVDTFPLHSMIKTLGCTTQTASGEDVHFRELGTVQGIALEKFHNSSSFTMPDVVRCGQVGAGPSCNREINYDDVIWDLGTGADAALAHIPTFVRVYPFPVTGQGAFDQFSPAGAFANVAEIPRDNVASVSESVLGEATTYRHASLANASDLVYHVRCYMNATSNGNQHKIVIGAQESSFNFNAFTGDSDASTNRADKSYQEAPLSAAAFAALEFGGKVGTGGSTLTIKNILLEVLGGPAEGEVTFSSGPTPPGPGGVAETQIGLAWAEFTDRAGALHLMSKVTLPDPATYFGGYKEDRVTRWHPVRRALSDRFGQFEGLTFGWRASDVDRKFRGLLGLTATKTFINRPAVVRAIPDKDRRALLTPRTVARGLVRGYAIESELAFEFSGRDTLAVRFESANKKDQIPQRVFTHDDFPNAPETIAGKGQDSLAVPFIYGELSDRNEHDIVVPGDSGTPASVGLNKPQNLTAVVVGAAGTSTYTYGVTALDNRHDQWNQFAKRADHAGETDAAYVTVTNAPSASQASVSRYVQLDWNSVPGAHHYRIYGRAPGGTTNLNLLDSANAALAGNEERYRDGAGPQGGPGGTPAPTRTEIDVEKTDSHPPATNQTVVSGDPGTPNSTIKIDTGHGLVPVISTGLRRINGTDYHECVICGHAGQGTKPITSWYLDGVREQDSTADSGADYLIPGFPGWTAIFGTTYRDFNGRRYTLLYLKKDSKGDEIASGEKTLTVNFRGIETVGNGTGTLIADGLDQYLHCLQNFVLQNYDAGAWLSTPRFADDAEVKLIDETSFAAAKTIGQARVSGGYVGAFIVGNDGERLGARDLLARFNVSFDVDGGFNRKCQWMVSMIDETVAALTAGVPIFDVLDIVGGEFDITDEIEEQFNRVSYRFGQDYTEPVTVEAGPGASSELTMHFLPSGGLVFPIPGQPVKVKVTRGQKGWEHEDEMFNEAAAEELGEEKIADVLEFFMVRAPGVATDIITRRLARSLNPPRLIKFRMPLSGSNLELGQNLLLTHYGGVSSIGWTNHAARLFRHELDLETWSVYLEAYDMQRFVDFLITKGTGQAGDTWSFGLLAGSSTTVTVNARARMQRTVPSMSRGAAQASIGLPPALLQFIDRTPHPMPRLPEWTFNVQRAARPFTAGMAAASASSPMLEA